MTLRLPSNVKIELKVLDQLRELHDVAGPPCVIYARMSRDKTGAFLGIDRQLTDDLKVIRTHSLRVVAVYADNDMSAYSGKPLPEQIQMLEVLKQDAVRFVVTWHTDRLYRIPDELERFITVCDPRGITTHTATAGPLDLSTPSGRMAARVHCAVARYEVEHAIERRKSGNAQKAAAGLWLGGPRPFGYEPDGVTIRPLEADALEDVGSRLLAGEGSNSLARDLNARGIRTSAGNEFTGNGLRDVLLRPRNAGLMELNGEIVGPAQWRPIFHRDISDLATQRERARETWEAVCAVLMNPERGVGKTRPRKWLGTSLYLCGVHNDGKTTMTSGISMAGRPTQKNAYRCREVEHLKRSPAELIDEIVERTVIAYLQDERNLPRLLSRPEALDLGALHVEATTIKERITALDDELDDGVITKDRWLRRNQRLTTRLTAIKETLIRASTGTTLDGVLGPHLAERWYGIKEDRSDGFSLDRRAAIIKLACTVTVLPAPPGRPRVTDPKTLVRIVPRKLPLL